ncbi:MAG: hypothetical protein HYW06_08035 [Gemmatimonadetes bacterium]|nr:hypothetical protein [Gemmatimonadota bacterium]MBI2403219.1 hypothetical protein [Gemmatimonadota bacterium]MBI2536894.1 hypothetical protein [Gemmatimonadota bacterium]MBI2615255.1 hypothetical protein [Gemmatimonadota bacterium]
MTGCLESGTSLLRQELDRTIEAIGPLVEALLQRLSPSEAVTNEPGDAGWRAEVPLRFPDGVGHGSVVAQLFRYHDTVRLDIQIEHNRRFVRPDGTPSDRRCYLNDFQASITLPRGATELPEAFPRAVVSGVLAAREGVGRHNRLHPQPWHQVQIGAV